MKRPFSRAAAFVLLLPAPVAWAGVLFLVCCASASAQPVGQPSLVPVRLQTESRVDPLGVDVAHPRLSWQLRARTASARGLRQTAYRVLVASSPEVLARDEGDVWDSGRVAGAAQMDIAVDGAALQPVTEYHWKLMVWDQDGHASAWSEPAHWYTGMLAQEWKGHWIAATADEPPAPQTREGVDLPQIKPVPLPLFRRTFSLGKRVRSAVVAVSGLGQYELRVNGKDVTASVMNPGWTDYRKRVFYNAYDVTRLLQQGENALAVMLGNGMYEVPAVAGRYTKFTGAFGQPKLILQLTVRFEDGSHTVIVTDSSWRTAPGPITFSSIYGGEDYDARQDRARWDLAGYDAAGWQPALEASGPGGKLVGELLQPIVVAHTFHPVRTSRLDQRTIVYDLGMNFSGWPNMVVRGPRGSRVKLLAGELLDGNGHVTQLSNNAHPGDENAFHYTLKGGSAESWHPQFSYNGFRYVQVELSPASDEGGHGDLPTVLALTGSFLHDGVQVDGDFTSAKPLFGHIHRLIDQAILSNMFSVITDCPTREKLGWLEQTHLAATSIMYNYDVRRLYMKMADDMADSQTPDGLVPGIAPEYVAFVDHAGKSTAFRDSPEWGSASILSPFAAYRFYGDAAILAEHYETMQRYIAYLGSKAEGHILAYGLGDWYDIGPAPPGVSQLTSKGLTATAIYYQDLLAMVATARILENGEASRYANEAALVKEAFNRAFFHPDSARYDRGSQTAYAMPLALGLVPEGEQSRVLENMVADIRNHGDHVTAGDVGFHYVVRALTDAGRSDVLAAMLSRTDSPSYGYQIAHGATSLTEAWDSNPSSSQNHLMLGHAEEWFYRGLAGIDVDFTRPEEERLAVHPATIAGLASAAASVETVLGTVSSSWRRTAGGVLYSIAVPAGQVARITLRAAPNARVTDGGRALRSGGPFRNVERTANAVTCLVGSGSYRFFVPARAAAQAIAHPRLMPAHAG